MSQQIRQSEIFAGEDWTVLYRAFNQINFNSYDPPSINAALREYIQTNYPEDFNDWIESSEFVAIIDLLSWLAGSLAFRTDVNARENFLETAQARESVLRLARFLSYNPRRAQSARGMVKITEVKTTQIIQDSFGLNLNNRSIKWNDPDNPDWMEQFTLVLNACFPVNNPFGIPLKSGVLGSANTQLYRMTTTTNNNCVYRFSAVVDGTTENFELVNVDFETSSGFSERSPNPGNGFHILYRNDGKGNASTRTGFFMFFKQGTLKQELFTINTPVENRLIDLTTQNISETDVWVQSIGDSSQVTSFWEKVPALFSENITFNSIGSDIRDIFSVITRDNDTVSLRFGDGRFGTVPVGNLKTWYRTVNGKQYQIRPRDIENITVSIPYQDSIGREQTLTIKISLMENVSNAVGSETIDQIRARAPQVYGTQNRMVSGEDYNVFPLSNNEIVKLRAVNRVYSGHSRFIDINDPTSTIQDAKVITNDGMLYREDNASQYTQVSVSSNFTSEQIITKKILPMLKHVNVQTYFTHWMSRHASTYFTRENTRPVFVWRALTGNGFNSTGYLDPVFYGNALEHVEQKKRFRTYVGLDSKILFSWIDAEGPKTAWATLSSTDLNGYNFDAMVVDPTASPMIVDDNIPDGAEIIQVIPPYRATFDGREMLDRPDLQGTSEFAVLEEYLTLKRPFRLWYLFTETSVIADANATLSGRWIVLEPTTAPPEGAINVMTGTYMGGLYWSFEVPIGVRYVFQSNADVRWHDLKNHKVVDGTTGYERRDTITVKWPKAGGVEEAVFDIVDNIYDPDGLPDTRRVVVVPQDSDDDGFADIPTSFKDVVDDSDYVVFIRDTEALYQPLIPQPDFPTDPFITELANGKHVMRGYTIFITTGSLMYPKGFYKWDATLDRYVKFSDLNYIAINGKAKLRFEWNHYSGSNIRIDPAITNIIDCFVLTTEYDYLTRQWIKNGTPADQEPSAPTDLSLEEQFSEFEQYKMFSDQLIWRPVKYKYLFGSSAQAELQAQFKVVRLPNSQLSDGEIRSRVITAINDYFDVNKWEFGETFYFTELAAYIHLQLATAISSVVIVPLSNGGKFGELFEVRCNSNEMFISTAQVSDVVIIDGNTMSNLRIS